VFQVKRLFLILCWCLFLFIIVGCGSSSQQFPDLSFSFSISIPDGIVYNFPSGESITLKTGSGWFTGHGATDHYQGTSEVTLSPDSVNPSFCGGISAGSAEHITPPTLTSTNFDIYFVWMSPTPVFHFWGNLSRVGNTGTITSGSLTNLTTNVTKTVEGTFTWN
jgi:hypothetical protein